MAKLKINRGRTNTFAYFYEKNGLPFTLEGATVFFTVKRNEWDTDTTDGTALIKKTITSHVDAAGGETAIELTPADTQVEPGEDYKFDITVLEADGRKYTTIEGDCTVDGSPTNRDA